MIKNKKHNSLLLIIQRNPLLLKKQQYIVLVLCFLMSAKVLASNIDTGFFVKKDTPLYVAKHNVIKTPVCKQTYVYVGANTKVYGLNQLTQAQIIKIPKKRRTSKAVFATKINLESIKIRAKSKQKKKYQSSKAHKVIVKSLPCSRGTLLKNRLAARSTITVRTKPKLFKYISTSQVNLDTTLYTYIMAYHNAVLSYAIVYNRAYILHTFLNQLYSRPPPVLV